MIVPDYARPTALMVPHFVGDIRQTLEEIAAIASRHVGVILLSSDVDESARFVERQTIPDHFSIVAAPYDTPWIRDRSPVAIADGDGFRWILPQFSDDGRDLDAALFGSISARPVGKTDLIFAHGNLVAGPDGIGLSTSVILSDNGYSHADALKEAQNQLGIRDWILIPPFESEMTHHVDTHVRFLSSDLVAIAYDPDHQGDRRSVTHCIDELKKRIPNLTTLELPMTATPDGYASPVNWVQIGRLLIAPRYPETNAADLSATETVLKSAGFEPHFVHSPTATVGGSVHCLTASIFV